MQKLELTINQTMGVITGNFEDIKKSLETEMAVYETKQFAEEDKQKAKGDLADLRKLRKAVNDRKVEVKKEYMKPYEVFEGKVKELIGVIDKPIALIDGQVKEFEAKRVEEKKQKSRTCTTNWWKKNCMTTCRWKKSTVKSGQMHPPR